MRVLNDVLQLGHWVIKNAIESVAILDWKVSAGSGIVTGKQ